MPRLPRECPLGIVVKFGEFSDLQVNLLELSRRISQNKPRVLGDAFGLWFGRRPNVHAHCDAGLGAFLRRFFRRCNALFYPVDEFPIFGMNFLQFWPIRKLY